ncbi:MAG: DNRLRE domain-containing protein, partial [Candidatus Hodarchaeaceae archaeon]|nr:DNRLRE domain-containing protein [Candidatus Hodarchaeaceae archaeon]
MPEERGAWVPLAAILMVSIFIISTAIYYTTHVPKIQHQREREQAEAVKEDFIRLQERLNELGVGQRMSVEVPTLGRVPGVQRPLVSSLRSTDSGSSAVRVLVHNSRWDFEGGPRSENGLSKNIYIISDPNSRNYGAITLDNRWLGNRWITNTHRTYAFNIFTKNDYKQSARFVAEENENILSALAHVYVYGTKFPRLRLTYTTGETQELYAVGDAYVSHKNSGTNFGLDDEVKVGTIPSGAHADNYRTFLKFYLSRVPAGKSISQAQIVLSCS